MTIDEKLTKLYVDAKRLEKEINELEELKNCSFGNVTDAYEAAKEHIEKVRFFLDFIWDGSIKKKRKY